MELVDCAGDTALICLIDHLAQQLQPPSQGPAPASGRTPRAAYRAGAAAVAVRADGCNRACHAATLVTVISETMFGASPAWGSGSMQAAVLPEGQAGMLSCLHGTPVCS